MSKWRESLQELERYNSRTCHEEDVSSFEGFEEMSIFKTESSKPAPGQGGDSFEGFEGFEGGFDAFEEVRTEYAFSNVLPTYLKGKEEPKDTTQNVLLKTFKTFKTDERSVENKHSPLVGNPVRGIKNSNGNDATSGRSIQSRIETTGRQGPGRALAGPAETCGNPNAVGSDARYYLRQISNAKLQKLYGTIGAQYGKSDWQKLVSFPGWRDRLRELEDAFSRSWSEGKDCWNEFDALEHHWRTGLKALQRAMESH